MNDRFARVLTGLAVLAVAVIAAAVSFSHIRALALTHGYSPDTGALLPFSVDGLLVVSSLVLLTEARAQRPAPRLARFGLVLGIAGTLAANVAYGVHFGPVGALVNAWPAAAFITATEILVSQMRRAGGIPTAPEAIGAVADGVHGPASGSVPVTAPVVVPEDRAPTAPAATVKAVTSGRAPRRSSGHSARSPEKLFSAELESGQLPSIRQIKARARVGTPKAQEILAHLQDLMARQGRTANAA